ncbi:MAG: hypothetical protein V4493_02190 [Pseudomonadota bacterium]
MIRAIFYFLRIKTKYVFSYTLKFWRPGAYFITFPETGQFTPIISEAISRIMQSYGGVGEIEQFVRRGYEGEDTQKRYIVFNLAGSPTIFVMLSIPKHPITVRVAADCAISAREHLGAHHGSCVLIPLEVGLSDGVYFAISPYCYPRNRWEIYRQREQVLTWLSEVARHTVVDSLPEETESEFEHPLLALSQYSQLPKAVKALVQEALVELKTKRWRPRLSLMHNDLHRGNILSPPPESKSLYPFVIVDWGGLRLAGNAINDLIHLAQDLKLSPSQLAPYLKIHCEILKCNPTNVKYYLFSVFGIFLLNPEICPYAELAIALSKSLDYLDLTVAKIMEMNV